MDTPDPPSRRSRKADPPPPDAKAIEWFYRQQGRTYGPVSSLDLRAAARLGFLGPDDVVRRQGHAAWVPAGSLRWLFKRRRDPR